MIRRTGSWRARGRVRLNRGDFATTRHAYATIFSAFAGAPLGATVGLTDLHCEDQEQTNHAYQIADLAHAYVAFEALPRGEREIFTP
jgi:hypothetical protein